MKLLEIAETEENSKKSFLKRFWWVGVLIILVILGVILYEPIKKNLTKSEEPIFTPDQDQGTQKVEPVKNYTPFTEEGLKKAETALYGGITIQDSLEDHRMPLSGVEHDGLPNNPSPAPLGYTDLKSVSIGADSDYIYIKYIYNGIFPETPSYNGEYMEGVLGKVDQFNNPAWGKEFYQLIDVIQWRKQAGASNDIAHYSFNATGDNMSNNTSEGFAAGGVGTDYLLGAFPLSKFKLKLGDYVTFIAGMESGSRSYHHQNIDPLIADTKSGKFGATIKYQLGSSKYQILKEPVIK